MYGFRWELIDDCGDITTVVVNGAGKEVLVTQNIAEEEGAYKTTIAYKTAGLDDYIAALTEARRAIS